MARKLLCGFALLAGLALVGCGSSSAPPSKSKEEIDKETKKAADMMADKMKAGPGGAGATAPMGDKGSPAPMGEKDKK